MVSIIFPQSLSYYRSFLKRKNTFTDSSVSLFFFLFSHFWFLILGACGIPTGIQPWNLDQLNKLSLLEFQFSPFFNPMPFKVAKKASVSHLSYRFKDVKGVRRGQGGLLVSSLLVNFFPIPAAILHFRLDEFQGDKFPIPLLKFTFNNMIWLDSGWGI